MGLRAGPGLDCLVDGWAGTLFVGLRVTPRLYSFMGGLARYLWGCGSGLD